jgi:GNAT superfamily N-acetyltransferase
MILSGEDNYKDALQKMWKLCFPGDTQPFIRFYFDKVYQNDETLICLENGQAVASLQILPYRLKTGNVISLAGYISGAMTHPDFRQKGYMTKLLTASFDIMKEKNYAYTFLIPQEKWLFGFYEKYGYKYLTCPSPTLSPQKERDAGADRKLQAPHPFSCQERLEEKYYSLYSGFLMEKTNVVLKTKDQFSHILWDFFQEKGVLFANEAGMAFTLKKGRQIILKEFFYRNEEIKQLFLKSIRNYYNQPELMISDRSAGCKGMIKSLDDSKETILAIYINMMLN